ncbi:MAG: dihydroorotase [Oscillospiraceae bacterium]
MGILLSGGRVYTKSAFHRLDVAIDNGRIISLSPNVPQSGFTRIFDFNNCFIVPGFVDVHVHLREPGFCYKETIKTGTLAAARGGYTTVCTMPNLSPPPDSTENLQVQLDAIALDARIGVIPCGCITMGERGDELSDMEGLAPYVFGFSDDGRGVQSESIMLAAMKKAKSLNKPIIAHCEDNSLLGGSAIHAGEYAARFGLKGITSESEYRQIERDLNLVAKTGCRYHICHISTRESVNIIREAKKDGLPITCETAPHYLVLCDADLRDDGRFKMNPPLRSRRDQNALLEGLTDGTIDVIATDHAPHSAEEKSKGLKGSLMGIVGLETAFSVLYTGLVQKGVLTLESLVEKMAVNPRKIFGLGGGIECGEKADITVINTAAAYKIDSSRFLSMGRSTPFDGKNVEGDIAMTIYNGGIVWNGNLQEN